MSCYIIAETGVNDTGLVNLAKQMIGPTKQSGTKPVLVDINNYNDLRFEEFMKNE